MATICGHKLYVMPLLVNYIIRSIDQSFFLWFVESLVISQFSSLDSSGMKSLI